MLVIDSYFYSADGGADVGRHEASVDVGLHDLEQPRRVVEK